MRSVFHFLSHRFQMLGGLREKKKNDMPSPSLGFARFFGVGGVGCADKQNEIRVDGICRENPLNLLIFFTWNFF